MPFTVLDSQGRLKSVGATGANGSPGANGASVFTRATSTSTGAQNNFAPGISNNTVIEWNGASDITVSGFTPGSTGLYLVFKNISAVNAYFLHNSGLSTAGNKIFNNNLGGTLLVGPKSSAEWYYDGTQWQLITTDINDDDETRYANIVAPVDADFAWVNQGSSTIRNDVTSVVLTGAGTGTGANVVARVKTAPAAPYVITARLIGNLIHKPFQSYGLCFRDSASGKLAIFDVLAADAGLTTLLIRSTKFTNATTFSADYTSQHVPREIRWLRIADDNTNRVCSISYDGVDWIQIHSIGRTDFLTANQVGFVVGTENSLTPNFAPIVRVTSWRQT